MQYITDRRKKNQIGGILSRKLTGGRKFSANIYRIPRGRVFGGDEKLGGICTSRDASGGGGISTATAHHRESLINIYKGA